MAEKSSRAKKEQAKRAQRLREQIERLKQGKSVERDAHKADSLREQIEARAAEQSKSKRS